MWDKASDNAHLKWDLCEAQAATMHTSGGIRVEMWGKRKRLQDLEPFLWAGTDSNCRSREATDLQSARFNHLPTYPKFWASCRIRTNDPEITNHVLWPTELKRRLLVEAAVACFKRVQRYELFLKHQIFSSFFAVFFQKKFISHHLSPFFAPKPRFPDARRQKLDNRN